MSLNRLIKLTLSILFVVLFSSKSFAAENNIENLKVDWSFAGITGKFDRSSLKEVIKFIRKSVQLAILCNI